jgi:4-hydroxy-2-oxoheptanedioate aldolase
MNPVLSDSPVAALRAAWARGDVTFDCWITGTSALTAETIGRADFDAVTIDMQHSPVELPEVTNALRALVGSRSAALVRIPSNDPIRVGQVLDAGADGIVCPVVNTPAEARRLVEGFRYPPDGIRSVGAYRTQRPVAAGLRPSEDLLVSVQIETAEALENVEEIAATPGVDIVFAGSVDLAVSYGQPAVLDWTDRLVLERHRRIADAAHSAGKAAGVFALGTADEVQVAIGLGYDHIVVASEQWLLRTGAADALRRGREASPLEGSEVA